MASEREAPFTEATGACRAVKLMQDMESTVTQRFEAYEREMETLTELKHLLIEMYRVPLQQRTVEKTVDVFMPQTQEQIDEAVKETSPERVPERIVEQTRNEIIGVILPVPQVCISEFIDEKIIVSSQTETE